MPLAVYFLWFLSKLVQFMEFEWRAEQIYLWALISTYVEKYITDGKVRFLCLIKHNVIDMYGGKGSRESYQLDRRLWGPQSMWMSWEQKHFSPCCEIIPNCRARHTD